MNNTTKANLVFSSEDSCDKNSHLCLCVFFMKARACCKELCLKVKSYSCFKRVSKRLSIASKSSSWKLFKIFLIVSFIFKLYMMAFLINNLFINYNIQGRK
ncbi:hypothetical protein CQA75_04865 [Campylobacter taeniopygiae]|uniref:Uncharacterized protein n=1 Tax=Campylobacter taeniopygiae TaxID=2510188 RepID=A0ABY2TJ10_9BACT|nr:hypothetical protein CQA75_04865 [Campylobacter taeniopygiae]